MDREWMKTGRRILRQVRKQISKLEGDPAPELVQYENQYQKDVIGRWRRSSMTDLQRSLLNSQVILGGDFHAFWQSQRVHLRVLREMIEQGNKPVMALECLNSEDQEIIDSWMGSKISTDEFFQAINWDRQWGFPKAHYLPLMEFAKEHSLHLSGINKSKSTDLNDRDRHSAEIICKLLQMDPCARIYVIIGDWHLSDSHLPKEIRKLWGGPLEIHRIFQNVDRLYFRFSPSAEEVLRQRSGTFCILSAPPWVKWQSYLLWKDQSEQMSSAQADADWTDQVQSVGQLLSSTLQIEVNFSHMAVYSSADLNPIEGVRKQLSAGQKKVFDHLVDQRRTFVIPEKSFYYLGKLSVNHAAFLATLYFQIQFQVRQTLLWSPSKHFMAQVWCDGLAFGFSKMLNPARKAESLERLQANWTGSSAAMKKVLQILLHYSAKELKGDFHSVWNGKLTRNPIYWMEASRIISTWWGERIFRGWSTGVLSLQDLQEALSWNVQAPQFLEKLETIHAKIKKQPRTS